jgi:hypothetical protein
VTIVLRAGVVLAVAAHLAGCAQAATARQVRRATDGGTVLVGDGSGVAAATRQAVSGIEQHCRGVHEVVEIAQVETGRTNSTSVAYSFGPVAVGTSGSSPVYGTSITYLCREAASTSPNESVLRMATTDILGRQCRSDEDRGPLFCARAAPAAEHGACSAH